jgi:outer membrane protein
MKIITAILTTSLSLLIASSSVQAADFKVGIVDMTRVFAEYGKTKDAEDKVEGNKDLAKRELDAQREKYKKLIEKYQEYGPKLKDPGISETLRKSLTKKAEALGGEIRTLERQNAEEVQRRERQLQEEASQLRAGIMDEIAKVVAEHARLQNYDIVFDKTGLSTRGIPFLLYTKEAVDFSEDIIKILNKE